VDVGATGRVDADGLMDIFDALGYCLTHDDAALLIRRMHQRSAEQVRQRN
jgi:hypothetical protein